MTWFLVLVWVYQGTPSVEIIDKYKSMYDCFYAFELYEDQVQEEMQLVCVKEKTNE
jgi:23S rRNA U2552 (ribose-2'-O)-methylase RlmE/FtsJ